MAAPPAGKMAGWSCAEDSPDPYGPCAASSPTVVLHCVVEDNSSPRQVLAIHRPQAAGMPQRLAHTAPAAAFPPETIIGVSDSGAVGGITSSPSSSSDSTTGGFFLFAAFDMKASSLLLTPNIVTHSETRRAAEMRALDNHGGAAAILYEHG
ncbi:unnamed protein product [Lampetra planeri]